MGRHHKPKKDLIHRFIKLALIAVFLVALFFVFYSLLDEKSTSSVNEDELSKKTVDIFKEDEDIFNVKSKDSLLKEDQDIPSIASKDWVLPAAVSDSRPIVAIVVDDGGNSLDKAKRVASLDLPLTWAILPYTRYAGETSTIADATGIPYLLHLPMQAEIDKNPKEYLVGEGMDRNRIRDVTIKALDSLPSPIGINNHRGSLATSKWDIMVPVIDILKERDLLFLDSRTSRKSVAYDVAKAADIIALRNRSFLDGTQDKDLIRARFDEVVKTAINRGDMIAICHFRPVTLLFLEKLSKDYLDLPVRLVTLTEMAEILREKEEE